jgi:hypothetical protein
MKTFRVWVSRAEMRRGGAGLCQNAECSSHSAILVTRSARRAQFLMNAMNEIFHAPATLRTA